MKVGICSSITRGICGKVLYASERYSSKHPLRSYERLGSAYAPAMIWFIVFMARVSWLIVLQLQSYQVSLAFSIVSESFGTGSTIYAVCERKSIEMGMVDEAV
jgi:hypothetical protein